VSLVEAHELDLRELRYAGALMLGLGAVLSRLPGHEGLPCPLRTLTGVPCPLCGMTTSVEETFRLHLGDALAANPMGVAAVAVAAGLLALRPASVRMSLLPLLVTLSAMWVFELFRFSIL
jgi:hypothetical protein